MDQEVVRPAILVRDLHPARVAPYRLSRQSPLGGNLAAITNINWFDDVLVVPVSEPQLQAAPGDSIASPHVGTLGAGVMWSGKQGFLSAGHVAKPVNAIVRSAGKTIGTIVYSNDPAGRGTAVEDDAALIELAPGVGRSNIVSSAGLAGPGATVSLVASGKAPPATIMGKSQFLFMPTANATCGDVYFTTTQFTQPGHSGACVVAVNGDLIGHVLGASPGYTSYIQDVHFQLNAIASQPAFAGLVLG
jgi:hypothetical protein